MTRDEMLAALRERECKVIFEKVNGDTRIMRCTLKSSELPDTGTGGNKPNEKLIVVWDLVKEAWRSFRVSSVKKFV